MSERDHLDQLDHPELRDPVHRSMGNPMDPMAQPERALVVDDYESQVHGAGSHTQASIGGLDPARRPGRDPADARSGAERGSP